MKTVQSIHPATYIFAARALRDFGDGFVAILLSVYLLALGFSPLQVGVIATASLSGSALLTIAIGFLGARRDLRGLLLAAAGLMVASGVAMSIVNDYALLLVVAFAGTINPSAGSVSVFVPLEHAVLTREVAGAERTSMFARYSLAGALASAVGALAAALPDFITIFGFGQLAAIKLMFVLYALLGLAGAVLYARMPPRIAASPRKQHLALRALLCSSSQPCSASMHSLAGSWCSRCSPCGCSSNSICRSRKLGCFSSGRACSRPSLFLSPHGYRSGVASSTRWCSLTSHRASP